MNLSDIKYTDNMQPRIQINYLIVDDYAEAMSNGNPFPPIEVVFDGESYWMWDGFHRLEAAKKISLTSLDANVTEGIRQDAEWLALSANKGHGLHRSNEDKRRSVKLALQHPNGKEASARFIAEWCGVSNDFVSRLKNELGVIQRHVNGKDGKTYTIRKSPTEKIKVRDLINGTFLADNPQELKDLAKVPAQYQAEAVNLVLGGTSKTIRQAYKELKRLRKLNDRQSSQIEIPSDSPVWHGDFREVGQKIPDNSVDLIFTDPPYNKDAIQLYRDLGIFASRVLKPGGLCLAYSGQIFLPQVLNALSGNLEYIWCFAVRHSSGYTRIFKINGRNMWKPIVFFVKPPYETWWKTLDDMIDGQMEKSDHEWQQGISEAEFYLKKLSVDNALIVDPFAGSGTTLLAAKNLGLRFIGIEDDLEDVQRINKKLND